MNHLNIEIKDSPREAPNWSRDHVDVRAAEIEKVIIVCNGTASGKSTVDFVFNDPDGGTFVTLLTGALVKDLAAAIAGAEQRRK